MSDRPWMLFLALDLLGGREVLPCGEPPARHQKLRHALHDDGVVVLLAHQALKLLPLRVRKAGSTQLRISDLRADGFFNLLDASIQVLVQIAILPYFIVHPGPQLLQHPHQVLAGPTEVASLDCQHRGLVAELDVLGLPDFLQDLNGLPVIIADEEVCLGQFELVGLVEVAEARAAAAVGLNGEVVILVVEELA